MHEHWKINGWKVSQLTEHRVTRSILVNFSLSTTSLIQSFAKLCFIFFFSPFTFQSHVGSLHHSTTRSVCILLLSFLTAVLLSYSDIFEEVSIVSTLLFTSPFNSDSTFSFLHFARDRMQMAIVLGIW